MDFMLNRQVLTYCSIATNDFRCRAVEGATAAEKAAMRFFKVVVEVQ